MSSRRRRNRGLPQPGRPVKKGRPAKADIAEDEQAPSRIYARNLLETKPRVEWSDISSTLELVTDELGDYWTQQDEDAILAIWDRSPEKQLILGLPQFSSYLKLWKYCIRILNSSPNWILSPIYGLRYQATGNNAASARGEIPSKLFCEHLASLITHHCHGGRVSQLALLLQYAAFCRLDDRRYFAPFDRELVEKCPALTLLYNNLDELVDGRLPESLHSMHASARRDILENEETPSELSDLLHHIGEMVMSKRISRVPIVAEDFLTQLDMNVLPLTLWDLIAVIDAVDTMNFSVPSDRYTVAEAQRSFIVELKGSDIPSRNELPEIFELTFKAMLRCIRMALQPETDSSSQGDIDMPDLDPQEGQENEPETESESGPESRSESRVESGAESNSESRPVSLNLSHGSLNLYPIRARESTQLFDSRAEEIDSLREEIQQLRESRAQDRETIQQLQESRTQDREIISDLREQLRTQGGESAQVLQRVEKQNMEFIQKLKDEHTQFIKGLQENTNLLLRLQSSDSRGAVATVNTARSASPELDDGRLPETSDQSRTDAEDENLDPEVA
ncbi:Ff.00g079290.m01.CDS01 [Fusarium sp. VM40]|nr:Ff.00g079290.m01.CDS01 [Fusarium sp. VM40]